MTGTTLAGRRAIVTDAHTTSALAVVRSLNSAGMSVTVIREADRYSLAAHSRHANRVVTLPRVEQRPDLYLDGLLQELETGSYDILIPTTDSAIAAIRSRRDRIERAVRLALPPDEALIGAQDKQVTVERATANGVCVPQTSVFASPAEVHAAADRLEYPCVVKPRFSRHWDGAGPMTRGAVQYAHSPDELRRIFDSSRIDAHMLLVQQFVHGTGVGVFALMEEGEPRALFAHRRLREANPTGGRASLAESIAPEARIVSPALRLLRALRWTGVAMVEFKDPGPLSPPVAMEVNGRFWGSLPLAIAAGVDFPVLLARQTLGLEVDAPGTYTTGVRCRHLVGDLSYLIASLKGRPPLWTDAFPRPMEALAAVAPWPGRWRSFNMRMTDPLPALGEATDFLRQTTRSLIRRSRGAALKAALEP
jgi:predicted ATP-grasp superfamily ATP-dependent carboligase